jgi:capsule biosynthesis phosphatase
MKYIFDIDGTICSLTNGDYEKAQPFSSRIKKVNKLYEEGNQIILFTARGMGRTNDNQMEAINMFYNLTLNQVTKWGLKFHRLVLGKPSGDIYIDDKGVKDNEFFAD